MNDLDDYFERAEEIMPVFSYWGEGIIVINKEQWRRSRYKIQSLLKHLHQAKCMLKEVKDGD